MKRRTIGNILAIAVHAAALVIASGVGALLLFALDTVIDLFGVFCVIFVIGTVLGMPVYLAIAARRRLRALHPFLTGFLIGGILPLLLLPAEQWEGIIDAPKALIVVGFGGLGGLCALVFWWIARPFIAPPGGEFDRHRAVDTWRQQWAAAAMISAPIMAASLWTIERMKERPTYGLCEFPEVGANYPFYVELQIGPEEWEALSFLMKEFAEQRGWRYRSKIETEPRMLDIEICHRSGVAIPVTDDFQQSVQIPIHIVREEADWQPAFTDLHRRIERRWPGKTSFHRPDGEKMSRLPGREARTQ
ncbi:MAG TPA: hypothetical protein VGD10_01920 [Allosphingosinicella sp.]|uniref:hypothetical protein n=1 Tax=Allosphingosinicella sp. TaxID=2823234 RepID=UPI002ED82F41